MNLFLKNANLYKYLLIFLIINDMFWKEEAKGYLDFE